MDLGSQPHVRDPDPRRRGDRIHEAGIAEDGVVVDHHGHLFAAVEHRQDRAARACRRHVGRSTGFIGEIARSGRIANDKRRVPEDARQPIPEGCGIRARAQLDNDSGRGRAGPRAPGAGRPPAQSRRRPPRDRRSLGRARQAHPHRAGRRRDRRRRWRRSRRLAGARATIRPRRTMPDDRHTRARPADPSRRHQTSVSASRARDDRLDDAVGVGERDHEPDAPVDACAPTARSAAGASSGPAMGARRPPATRATSGP